MTRFRLLATDLDGTLFGHDLVISPRTRKALARLAERDCRLAIATGRMFRATLPIAEDLGVTLPLITYQGALVRCPLTRVDTWHQPLPRALAGEALEALAESGLHVNLYLDDELVLRDRTPEAESYLALARVTPVMCASWEEAMIAHEPTKIVGIGPEAKVVALVAAFRERFGDRLFVTQSQPTFIEITHPAVNKGAALDRLAASLGIAASEIVAVGDGQNDVEMIGYAGLGVAMGQGHAALKAAAGRVTKPLAEDGVACLIDDLIAEGLL